MLHKAEIEPARRKFETEQDGYNLTLRTFPPTFAEPPERNEEALRRCACSVKRWESIPPVRWPTPSRHGVSSSAI